MSRTFEGRWRGITMAALLTAGCGARTGLRVDPPPPVDASVDAPLAPEPRCRALRVRARVTTEAVLHLAVDDVTPQTTGYSWALRQAPRRSVAMVTSVGNERAALTPDVVGTYDIGVTTPYRLRNGEALRCPVTVLADPLDPLCPGDALEEPTVAPLTRSQAQLALDPAWSTPRVADDPARSFTVLATDAPADDVAALVIELPESRPLAEAAGLWEGRIAASVGAVPVLVGREGRTDEGWAMRRSSFRLAALETSAAVVRDRVARDVTALNPGPSRPGFGGARNFTLEVSTVLRPDLGRAIILVAAAPEARFDDVRTTTAIRLQDLSNATGLGDARATLDTLCQRIVATRAVSADFLWLVDTSRSMEDDQERLGNVATRFYREMNAAGIDLRVGVVQAGSAPAGPDLDTPGFAWINGSDPEGAQQLAWAVTYQRFANDVRDTRQPYPEEGGEEEPLAAAVTTAQAMDQRTADATDARRFRAGAQRVAFLVTDEAGTNDDERYFAYDRVRWGALRDDRVRAVTRWFGMNGWQTFAMANLFSRSGCPSTDNFVPCVVTGNGGAYIPISTATDAEVSAALSRIVDAVAGAASEFTVAVPPISASLRVRVDATLTPRSRADGFDYDDAARTILFRGTTFRPRQGQAVRTAYFRWR
jgi:hypothetical protein